MSDEHQEETPQKEVADEKRVAGYCSATCVTKEALREEIKKPPLKTSDIYATCNLPKRFEHPHWFNGYGSQQNKQHPFYRTTSSEYGYYPPGIHTVPSMFFPAGQKFTNKLAAAGMYRIHSVTTVFYPSGQKFTNALAASGMYRNYSLNTDMDMSLGKAPRC